MKQYKEIFFVLFWGEYPLSFWERSKLERMDKSDFVGGIYSVFLANLH